MTLVVFKTISIRNVKIEEKFTEEHYIFDKNFRADKKISTSSGSPYFSNGVVTAKTLDLFRFLEKEFTVKSLNELNDHFNKVEQYLNSKLSESEARKLYEIYQNYLRCQIAFVNDPQYRPKTADPHHLLILLISAQNYRREKLGKETADALFGNEVKENEYFFRRAIIIGDSTLYGKEKENRLQKLKTDMWGDEEISIGEDCNPYNRYQLKLQLYQKDLSEMSEGERKLKIEEFRKEFFSKGQLKRLRGVDDQIVKEAEAFRRREAIYGSAGK
jgi:lipase chaperone LimK